MKIAIMSDSHDRLEAIEQAMDLVNEREILYLIHLGDFVSPFSVQKIKERFEGKVVALFGNNDGEKVGLSRLFDAEGWEIADPPVFKTIAGKKFLLFHSLPAFEKVGFEVDYVLHGHSHVMSTNLLFRKGESILNLNPGELCGYVSGRKTFLILETDTNDVEKIVLP